MSEDDLPDSLRARLVAYEKLILLLLRRQIEPPPRVERRPDAPGRIAALRRDLVAPWFDAVGPSAVRAAVVAEVDAILARLKTDMGL